MWRAIKAVWASKWNSRAVSSLRKASLQHQDLQMAVLCQPVVSAQYAFVAHTTNPVTGLIGKHLLSWHDCCFVISHARSVGNWTLWFVRLLHQGFFANL